MNTALWAVQAILALVFTMVGMMKLSVPKKKLAPQMGWVENVSPRAIKGIGLVEVLGAIGLILPMLLGILPWLTPLAALGLVLTMLVAMYIHLRRNERSALIVNVALLLLAAFVAYGRFGLFSA